MSKSMTDLNEYRQAQQTYDCPAWCRDPGPHDREGHCSRAFTVDLSQHNYAHTWVIGGFTQPRGSEPLLSLLVRTSRTREVTAKLTLAEARALADRINRLIDEVED